MNIKTALRTVFSFCLGMGISLTAISQPGQVKPKSKTTPAQSKSATAKKPAGTTAKPPGKPNDPTKVNSSDKITNSNVGRAPGRYIIKVKLKGFKNVPLYLADNFGDKQYFRDTCYLNAAGEGVFTGSPKLQRGMYMIVFPEMNGYYELVMTDDQDFYFEADTSMDETHIKVTGSVENETFAEYQKVRSTYTRSRYDADQGYKKARAVNDQIRMAEFKGLMDTLDKKDLDYRESYMAKYPNHYLSRLFKAFKSIKIPVNPDPKDSMFEYRFYKNHFWDNIDFTESGLVRAPQGLLTSRLNDYIDRLSFQDPDSLCNAVDIAIDKTVPYTETQKYFVQYLTNKFQDRKIMCQDNVTIHLIDKYYCKGNSWWYDDTAGKRKMCEEARKALPTMCGKMAPDLMLADTLGKFHRLYENLGKFTIVFFYDPTCGHCKQVIPIVNEVFQKHKTHGLRVYAISTENKYTEWREMMRNRPELQEWVNVCKTDLHYPWPYYKYDYNIQANPTIFILDENGKIVGKKIDEHQLEFFLESLMFEKGLISTKPIPPKETKEESKDTPAPPASPAQQQQDTPADDPKR